MSDLRLVLFDLDGTLIDSEPGIVGSVKYALAKLGVTAPSDADLLDWIGPPLRVSFARMFGGDDPRIEQGVLLYRERFSAQGWQEHRVYPGVAALIASLLARRTRLAVVTGKADLYAQRIVESLPFGSAFERVYASPPDTRDAGKADMIARALADFQMPPAHATMIGDRRFDIEGARANGVRPIGVAWGFGSREELVEAGADTIADDPMQLQALLG